MVDLVEGKPGGHLPPKKKAKLRSASNVDLAEKLRQKLSLAKRAVEALRAKAVLQGKDPDAPKAAVVAEKEKEVLASSSSVADSPKPSPSKSGVYMGMRIAPPWDIKLGLQYDILNKKRKKVAKIQAGLSAAVHIAPECSTFSRVRERKIPGVHCRPLRSVEFPEGFTEGLSKREYEQIEDANEIANWTASVCRRALADGRYFIVENPMRSYLWSLPNFETLAAEPGVFFVKCDSCMFGSSRYKPTAFLTNMPWAEEELGLRCEGVPTRRARGSVSLCTRTGVEHDSWDPIWDATLVKKCGTVGGWIYPSAGEAQYPAQLAEHIANCIKEVHLIKDFSRTADRTASLCNWAFSEFFSGPNAPLTQAVKKALSECDWQLEREATGAEPKAKSKEASGSQRPGDGRPLVEPDPTRDRDLGEARGSQWSEKQVRDLENEVCVGGLRNPGRAHERNPRLASVGGISANILTDFIDKHSEYLGLADGGEAAAALANRPLDDLREKLVEAWAEFAEKTDVVPRAKIKHSVARADNGSPWRPGVVEAFVEATGDPEVDLASWIREGTPMGIARRIEARGVFPRVSTREPTRAEADAVWVQTSIGGNYKSFLEAGDLAKDELQRTIDAGYAKVVGTFAEARAQYGMVAVSRLACILKERADGTTKVRLVVDLRRSHVNALVIAPERIVLPRLRDVLKDGVDLVRGCLVHEQVEAMVSDFADAFHSLPVHPDEEKYCLARIEGDKFLVFKTVMFGGVSSPLTWGRSGAFLMRGAAALVAKAEARAQCYVDDPIVLAKGDKEARSKLFSMVLLWFIIFGLKMSWKKVARGLRVDWCGATVAFPDRHLVRVSLSAEFVKALQNEVAEVLAKPLVKLRVLRHVVGRASWAFSLVPMLRPILAPLWAVLAELTAEEKHQGNTERDKLKYYGRDVAVEVKRVLPELLWIRAVMRRAIGRGELSRTVDARVFVGKSTVRITTDASPWGIGATLEKDNQIVAFLYDRIHEADASRLKIVVGSSAAQATCEALALLVAIRTWLPYWAEEQATAVTRSDSLSALGALAKGSSTSPPINLIVRETAIDVASSKYGLGLFKHVKGKDNIYADALSRIFAPGGADGPPGELRRPEIRHSRVAERNDTWWEAERLEEALLARHKEETPVRARSRSGRAQSSAVLTKTAVRRVRRKRAKARQEGERRSAVRLVPGPTRTRERRSRSSSRRSRSRASRSRPRDPTQDSRRRPAVERRSRSSSPRRFSRSASVYDPADLHRRPRNTSRRSSSPDDAGATRGGGRHRYEGGHQRFGPRR